MPLDAAGNGGGTISVDPGPHSSVVFTLAVSPRSGAADLTAQVNVEVKNFIAELQRSDGSMVDADQKVRVELGVSADGDPDEDPTQAAS